MVVWTTQKKSITVCFGSVGSPCCWLVGCSIGRMVQVYKLLLSGVECTSAVVSAVCRWFKSCFRPVHINSASVNIHILFTSSRGMRGEEMSSRLKKRRQLLRSLQAFKNGNVQHVLRQGLYDFGAVWWKQKSEGRSCVDTFSILHLHACSVCPLTRKAILLSTSPCLLCKHVTAHFSYQSNF